MPPSTLVAFWAHIEGVAGNNLPGRKSCCVASHSSPRASVLVLSAAPAAAAPQFATADEAKALLEKAIAAVKEDKAKAFEMFATGDGGFKPKDLYVWCANASDGILTVHPTNKGKELRDIKGKHGAPFGEAIMQNAAEGTIKETTYWWPRPGSDEAFEKTTYYTKVGDQVCGVGYYME